MKYIDVYRMIKQAVDTEPENVKNIRQELVRLLDKNNKHKSVFYMSNENMPSEHVIPYANSIMGWEGPKRLNGRLDMYFKQNGYPLGYSLDNEDGIHTDASDEELKKALIVALLSKKRAKNYGLM